MGRLSTTAAAIALAVTLEIMFILCAIVQMIAPQAQLPHMWISLFTAAPIGSPAAWLQGILSNAGFGLLAGFAFAWFYNFVAKPK